MANTHPKEAAMADWPTVPARKGIVMLWQADHSATHAPRQVLLLHPCTEDPDALAHGTAEPGCWVVAVVPRSAAIQRHARLADLQGACSHCGTFHTTTDDVAAIEACAEAQEADYQLDQAAARAERRAAEAGL
jgi:hypothetical protein